MTIKYRVVMLLKFLYPWLCTRNCRFSRISAWCSSPNLYKWYSPLLCSVNDVMRSAINKREYSNGEKNAKNGAIYIFGGAKGASHARGRKRAARRDRGWMGWAASICVMAVRWLRLSRITVIFRRQERRANFIAAVPDAKGRAGLQVDPWLCQRANFIAFHICVCWPSGGREGCSTRTAARGLPSCAIITDLSTYRPFQDLIKWRRVEH